MLGNVENQCHKNKSQIFFVINYTVGDLDYKETLAFLI